MASMIVLYGQPEDPEAFETYYAERHLPLAAGHMPAVTGAENMRIIDTARGKKGAYYRVSRMTFESPQALREALESKGGQAVLDDLDKFATGGASVLLAED